MQTPVQKAVKQSVSQSAQQLTSAAARQWTGLCLACCLALNLPLSMENLGAVKASLLLTFARQSRAGWFGGIRNRSRVEWSTFAPKALADSKRDSARMLVGTKWSSLNFLQSSLTRQIFLRLKTRRPLSIPSWLGGK